MPHFFIGVFVTAILWMLATYVRKNGLRLLWWQWALTVLGLAYATFVFELIVGFLGEGEPRAALVMGLITGIFTVIWAVLMHRFVFKPAAR